MIAAKPDSRVGEAVSTAVGVGFLAGLVIVIAAGASKSHDHALPVAVDEQPTNLQPQVHSIGQRILDLYEEAPPISRAIDTSKQYLTVSIQKSGKTLLISELAASPSSPRDANSVSVDLLTSDNTSVLSLNAVIVGDTVSATCQDSQKVRWETDQKVAMEGVPGVTQTAVKSVAQADQLATNILSGINAFVDAAVEGQAANMLSQPNLANLCDPITN